MIRRIFMRLLAVAAILAPAGVLLGSAPAYADGQIFAVVTLTNNTQLPISIPFSDAHTGSAWGTRGDPMAYISPGWTVMPDGTPPRILMPGQTMLWGTKSNGGFGATTGTGGYLVINLPEDQTFAMSWSVPWCVFNGNFCLTEAGAQDNVSEPSGFTAGDPNTSSGTVVGCSGDGDNTCVFEFAIGGGPNTPPVTPGVLFAGQSISEPSTCPPNMTCTSAIHALFSPDGSTALDINYGCNLGPDQQQSGGVVALSNNVTEASWREPACNIVGAQMLPDGDLVAWDANGDVVWSTETQAPGAFLSVGTSRVSVLATKPVCEIAFKHDTGCVWRLVNVTLWSASAKPSPPTP